MLLKELTDILNDLKMFSVSMKLLVNVLLYVSIASRSMAFLNMPAVYYAALRAAVFVTALVIMACDYKNANPFWSVLLGFTAIVFIPFFKCTCTG